MSIFDTSKTTETTLPSWYTSAQQDAATQAKNALAATTPFNQTVGQDVVKNFSDPNNPYAVATKNLLDIQSGNANAYLPNGQLNTQSPLGALFSAQNARLDQLLPGITAKEGAAGIGAGGFGSLRGQTATQTARGGALTTLAEQQAKALLDAQSQSINAGTSVGNLQQQYGKEGIDLANWQMAGGLPGLAKYEDILGAMATTLPKTAKETSSAGVYGDITKALLATNAGTDLLNKVLSGASSGLSWLDNILKNPSSNVVNTINTNTVNDSGYSGGLS